MGWAHGAQARMLTCNAVAIATLALGCALPGAAAGRALAGETYGAVQAQAGGHDRPNRKHRSNRRRHHHHHHRRHKHPRVRDRARAFSTTASQLASLRLIDYFPASDGWAQMWQDWNPEQIQVDMGRIAALHANAVRVIVNVAAFGFPHPSLAMRQRLSQVIAIAAEHGLRVELTLFDGWEDYAAVAESKTWASEILADLSADPRIAYIDLHNELPANTDPSALAWAKAMVPYVKSIDGGIPVTVSTSISSGLAPLEALARGLVGDPPSLYDVHYYGSAASAYATLAQAKQIAGTVPLFVGETGFATSSAYGWAEGLQPEAASLEAYQSYYFRMLEHATQALDLPPAAPWILYDMPGGGDTVWGEHMGILHANGSPKPAATAIAGVFGGGTPEVSFNNGFEEGSGSPELPTIWRRWLPEDAEFAIDHTVAHSGGASALIRDARGNHITGCPAFYVAPIAAISAGVTYTASAWVRGHEARGISRVVLVWTQANGRYVASSSSQALPGGSTQWQQLSVSARPPAGASAVEIDLQVCENPGSTWFDDVSFSPTT